MNVIDPRLDTVCRILNEIMQEQGRRGDHEQILSVLSDALDAYDFDSDEYAQTAEALSFALGAMVESEAAVGVDAATPNEVREMIQHKSHASTAPKAALHETMIGTAPSSEVCDMIQSKCRELESALFELQHECWHGSSNTVRAARQRVIEIKSTILPITRGGG